MIKNLIRYQKLDLKLMKMQREMISTTQAEKKEKYVKRGKEGQAKLIELDKTAAKNVEMLRKTLDVSDKGLRISGKYLSSDIESMNIQELQEMLQRCDKSINDFEVLGNKLEKIVKNSEVIINEFLTIKNDIMQCKKAIKELSKATEDNEEMQPEMDKIKEELAELEKVIPEEYIRRYKELKQSKVMLPITKMEDRSCCGCGVKLVEKAIDEIERNGFTICESCHRIIVKMSETKK